MIDDFLPDPEWLLSLAETRVYEPDLARFKGKRSIPYRDPEVRAVFEDVLGAPITDWGQQPYNGVFQITGPDDPIVWHADTQTYAAAIYLDYGCHPEAGTSFWRHRDTRCRRSPWDPRRDGDEWVGVGDLARAAAHAAMFNDESFLDAEQWELVDRVAAVFNRAVIWDAKLIHSATSYPGSRLVQLFFFTVQEELQVTRT